MDKAELIQQGINILATTSATQIINTLVDIHIKPIFEKNILKNKTNEIDSISKYLEKNYTKYSYISTIVFKNQQKTIEELYIPLTVKKSISMEFKENIEIYIDEYKDEFIPKYKKILLVDNAGMGKSTIMKFLYLDFIKKNKGIPIFIELRNLNRYAIKKNSKNSLIINYLVDEINGISGCIKEDQVKKLLEKGKFVFFLDGYDEINSYSKGYITQELQDFISNTNKNYFIISSREENELSSFANFQRFDINKLTTQEAYNLICKYDKNGILSKELISKLKDDKNLELLNEFLVNPLMVSLLYKAFEYKKKIPYKKHLFYEQVYNALFEEHDLTKAGAYVHDKKTNLDIDDFFKVLKYLACYTFPKGVIYTREELINYLNIINNEIIGINFKPSDFIYDLIHSVPIFIIESNNYRWIHKSFQDYFFACYLCNEAKKDSKKILEYITSNDNINKYYNILDFYYDLNYDDFSEFIILPLIKKFENSIVTLYNHDYYKNHNKEDIYFRKVILFNFTWLKIIKSDKENLDISGNDLEKYKIDCCSFKIHIFGTLNKQINTLLKLFKIKNLDIFENEYEYSEFGTHNFDSLKDIVYTLDDRIDNPINEKILFKVFNCILYIFFMFNTVQFLNIDKCLNFKNEIEKKLLNKNNLSFLFNNFQM